MARFRKFAVALLGAVVLVVQQLAELAPDNKWVVAAVAVLTAAGVYVVPNAKSGEQPA